MIKKRATWSTLSRRVAGGETDVQLQVTDWNSNVVDIGKAKNTHYLNENR